MLSRIAPRRIPPSTLLPSTPSLSAACAAIAPRKTARIVVPRRWNTPAPNPNSTQPLMSRRADRELPDVEATQFRWMRTLPLFVLAMIISTAAIINYQKSSSSTVAAILYALRTSESARALLGDEVYFARRIPWISGQMAQMQGVIDITFRVRGTRAEGTVRFHSRRRSARAVWETLEYWVEVDGERVDLLEDGGFEPIVLAKGEVDDEVEQTRGFRKAGQAASK